MRALVYHGPGGHLLHAHSDAADQHRPDRRQPVHHPPLDLDDIEEAYDVFTRAADTKALKVVLTRGE